MATAPGGTEAAATASAAAVATSAVRCGTWIHDDTFRATVSMSDVSWASYCRW